jgi:hypothetical protein
MRTNLSTISCSYGKVGAKTEVNYVIHPEHYRWRIPVGNLNPQWPNGLSLPISVHLFVFLPTPVGWSDSAVSPYFVSHELWLPSPGDPGRAGESLRMTTCSTRSRDRWVIFSRKKKRLSETWEITSIDRDGTKNHFRLRNLLWFFRRELENTNKISSLSGQQLPGR